MHTDPSDSPPPPLASLRVRELLSARGFKEHNHASELARILDLDRSQAYRRLKGEVAWSETDLDRVAEALDDTARLLHPAPPAVRDTTPTLAPAAPVAPPPATVDADIQAPLLPARGQLQPGALLDAGTLATHRGLVALQGQGGRWTVLPATEVPAGQQAHAVDWLGLRCAPRLRVALLEDDDIAAASMAEGLALHGVEAVIFSRAEALPGDPRLAGFDAFVLDWLLPGGTAGPLIESLRRDAGIRAPLVVVTGALDLEAGLEQQLQTQSARWNFSTLDKPVRPLHLANALRQLVKAARQAL